MFEQGAGPCSGPAPGSGPSQAEKALGAGPKCVCVWGGVTFKCGAEPLLRTCPEAERQHVQSGALEYGVPEFAGKSLGESVWVGFRPSTVGGGLPV